MRRALVGLVGVVLSVAAVGCGSSKAPGVSGALATELSYLPRDDPFVADVATDPHGTAVKSVNALISSIPAAQLGISALKSLLASRGVDYQTDIEPMFGNPVVFSAASFSTSSPTGGSFLLVWIPRNSLGLGALLKGLASNGQTGRANGATLYGTGSNTFAVQGKTLVYGSSTALVKAALARHASGTGMTPSGFATEMANLPRNTFMQFQGSLAGLIHGSALKLPWVAAIRGYAATLSGSGSGASLNFRVDTSGASLTGAQLPLASGTAPPELAGNLPIVVGVRDPAQTFDFVIAAGQSTSARGFAPSARPLAVARRKRGHDLNTFAALLTGNLIVESDGHNFLARADVSDPASAARQLAALPRVASDLFTGARGATRQPGGFLAVTRAHGHPLELGLVGREFVVGEGATASQLRAFAAAPTTTAPNASGPIAFRISLLELLHLTLKNAVPALVSGLLSSLGDITGSASATPSALTGNVALRLK